VVQKGLSPGETVVTEGQLRLEQGTQVQLADVDGNPQGGDGRGGQGGRGGRGRRNGGAAAGGSATGGDAGVNGSGGRASS